MNYSLHGFVPRWMVEVIEGISYKPGWKLFITSSSYVSGPDPYVYGIAAQCTVPDRVTNAPIVLHGPTINIYKEYLDEKRLVEIIFHSIRSLECHEIEEQFCYNGIRIYDPHREHAEKLKLYELAERHPEYEQGATAMTRGVAYDSDLTSPHLIGFTRLLGNKP